MSSESDFLASATLTRDDLGGMVLSFLPGLRNDSQDDHVQSTPVYRIVSVREGLQGEGAYRLEGVRALAPSYCSSVALNTRSRSWDFWTIASVLQSSSTAASD